MNKNIHIVRIAILAISLIVPANGCGGNSTSSVKSYNCLNNKNLVQTLPGTPNIQMRTSYCEDYIFKVSKISNALHIFVPQYAKAFNLEEHVVWAYLESLHIEVSVIPKIVRSAFDVNGNMIKDVPVTGLALSDSHIWVEIRTNQIWSSSLAHELVHVIIWHQNAGIHGDPDHEGKSYSGWTKKHTKFIKDYNLELFDKNI